MDPSRSFGGRGAAFHCMGDSYRLHHRYLPCRLDLEGAREGTLHDFSALNTLEA
jgi:hypothetical protein